MKSPGCGRGFRFSFYFYYSGWVKLLRHGDVFCLHGVRWFGGLTRVFAGYCGGLQRERATTTAKDKAIDGSLRPSGSTPAFGRVEAAARQVFLRDPRLKPWGTQKQEQQQRAKGEMRGFLDDAQDRLFHCALVSLTVQRAV